VIKKVVLTGGPCSGKTSVLNNIATLFPERVVLIPEMASLVALSNIPRDSELDRLHFQTAIFELQLFYEQLMHAQADRLNRNIICDRGTLDGAAYWPRGDFCQAFKTTRELEYQKYDLVIFLSSLSSELPEKYAAVECHSARTESAQEALALQEKLLNIWSAHPNIKYIQGSFENIADKVQAVLTILLAENIIC